MIAQPGAVAAERRQRDAGCHQPVGPQKEILLPKPRTKPLDHSQVEDLVLPTHLDTQEVAVLRLRIGRAVEAVPVLEDGSVAEDSKSDAVGEDAVARQS